MLKNQIVLFVSSEAPAKAWQCLAQEWQWELVHHDCVMDALGAYVMLFPSIIVVDSMRAVGKEVSQHVNSVLVDAPQSPLIVISLTAKNHSVSIQNHVWRIDLPSACQTPDFITQQLTQAVDMATNSGSYKYSQFNR